MTHLDQLFSVDDLLGEINNGYVQRRIHPTLPLEIYTYTRHCQYDRHWNDVTMRCRGLVIESTTGRVVAWPFPKFFNVSEHENEHNHHFAPPLPDEPFTVYEKVDGSLGIVFWYDGAWRVASKGSFTSEQAQWAQKWLDSRDTSGLDISGTYLCEIIYPENRIVVHYDPSMAGLCLLGGYTMSGQEIPLHVIQPGWMPVGYAVKQWLSTDAIPLSALVQMAQDNVNLNGTAATGADEEGWVIRFESGVRAKIKFSEYMRLHKIITGVNARDIWQAFSAERLAATGTPVKTIAQTIGVSIAEALHLTSTAGGALTALVENVPDEFDAWVRSTVNELNNQYTALMDTVTAVYDEVMDRVHASAPTPDPRADFARHVHAVTEDRTVRAAMFLIRDRRSYEPLLWKAVKPTATDPFRNDQNDEG